MFSKRTAYLSTLASVLLLAVSLSTTLQAADTPGDSKEVSDLLSQTKVQAGRLKNDASDMAAFTRSDLAWETHAEKIREIQADVKDIGETVSKLNRTRNTASPWQKTAIDRINPLLQELAANTTAIVNHMNKEMGRLLNTPAHKEYLETNAELAADLATTIADFVDYGKTKAHYEYLKDKLEVSEK